MGKVKLNIRTVSVGIPELSDLTITPSTQRQTFTHAGADGYDTVICEAVSLQSKEIQPTGDEYTVTPDAGKIGLSSVKLLEIAKAHGEDF